MHKLVLVTYCDMPVQICKIEKFESSCFGSYENGDVDFFYGFFLSFMFHKNQQQQQ